MDLFSIWRSSSIEILFSKRITSFLYAFIAIGILSHMIAACTEFLHAYLTIHEFDVSVGQFMFISFVLFLPFWVVGALVMRACLQRWRLALWTRRAIKLVAYDTKLSPAEAGFLVDFTYSHKELTATLLDLHFRGVIQLIIDSHGNIGINPGNTQLPISEYEQALLLELGKIDTSNFGSFTDIPLINAGRKAHKVLVDGLISRHVIQKEHTPNITIRIFFRFLYVLAGFVGWIAFTALIGNTQEMFEVVYPRYSVEFIQVFILLTIAGVVVAILLSSLWPRLNNDHKSTGYSAWIDAAGMLMYIRAVFKDRFSEDNIEFQDKDTLRDYSAYAIAYGIIPASAATVARILAVCNKRTY